MSAHKSKRPRFEVWRTPVAEEDLRNARADVQSAVEDADCCLAARGCAAANYRLSGDGLDRYCAVHLVRDWRMVVGFPTADEVCVLIIGRHRDGSALDIYSRLYAQTGVDPPGAGRLKPPCCETSGEGPVDTARIDDIVQRSKAIVRGRKPQDTG